MQTVIFKDHRHPEYGHCLIGVTGGDHLREHSPGVFIAPGYQWHVLLEGGEYSKFEHPEHGSVEVWNTHPTGELRWEERVYKNLDGTWHMEPNCLLAAKHFGIKLRGLTDEEWAEVLDGQTLKLEDLSEVEARVLEWANNRDGMATIITQEKVKLLEDDGVEWHYTIRSTPEESAIYDLQRKGLVTRGGSTSGCGFGRQNGHIYRSKYWYYITDRGRKILKEGKA